MSELKRSLAVVIGINQYVNGIPPLKTAVNDATKLAINLKEKHQYNVLQLLDTEATYARLTGLFTAFESKIISLPDGSQLQVEADDRVLFYFAGHGIAVDGIDNADGPAGFLVPQDAQLKNQTSWIPMQQLHDALTALPCRHLLIVLDCCFAGSFRWAGHSRHAVRSQKVYRERYDRFVSGFAQQVITSAAHDEKAADSLFRFGQRGEGEDHSPFAELLLLALSGVADFTNDGVITATELYLFLHSELGKTVAKQTPGMCQLKRHDKGEYIFPIPGFQRDQLDEAPKLSEKLNPYRGLESFDEEHSALFFGRKALINQLTEFVSSHQLTVVLGASGSGKSSLVKAGLIPQLRNESSWQILAPIRPGKAPFSTLNRILPKESAATAHVEKGDYQQATEILLKNLGHWMRLNPQSQLLLIIDQAEELFTLCHNQTEREQFLNLLKQALAAYSERLHIVLTLRSDFEAQFRDQALESYWTAARFIVPAMTRQELREAITEPATLRVLYFDPLSLVDQLMDEVMQMPGALPLLSFTLSELYLKYIKSTKAGERSDRTITQADYDDIGGVTRSLTQRADYELAQLGIAYEKTVRKVMLRMVAVGGGELARRQVLCSELEYPEPENRRVKEVIGRFVDARLLVKGQNTDDKEYVEPAHDALVRGWQKLRTWKDQELANLLLQRELTPTAEKWLVQKLTGFLWNNDPRLPLLKQVLKSGDSWFNKVEAEFVQRSIIRKHNNTIKVWGRVTGAFLVLGIVTLIAIEKAVDALNQSLEAYTASSKVLLSSNRELEALVEGVKAGEILKKNPFGLREDTKIKVLTTLQQLIYQVRKRNGLEGHTESVVSVSFSPDGNTIASASKDNTIKLWQPDGELLKTLPEKQNGVFSVSFCRSNAQRLISASDDGIIKLWQRQPNNDFKPLKAISTKEEINAVSLSPDCQTIATVIQKNYNYHAVQLWGADGRHIKTFSPPHQDQVRGLDFSPDGQILASASWDQTINLWNLKDGKLLEEIKDNAALYSVRFVDNQTIASAGNDGTIKLRDLNGKLLKPPFNGHGDIVHHLDVSQDGKTIVSTSTDRTVKLWNREDGRLLKNIEYSGTTVNQVSFSPDSQMIAFASEDKTVELWSRVGILHKQNLQGSSLSFSSDSQKIVSGDQHGTIRLWQRNGEFVDSWQAHDQRILRVAFSSNSQVIASASLDGTVKLWNLNGTLINTLPGHKDGVLDVSFSPKDQTIASAGVDKKVKLWSLDGRLLKTFERHTDSVTSVSFSPDGKSIASAGADNDQSIRIWSLDGTDKIIGRHQGSVLSVSFSPNGKMIASAGADSTIKIWSINGQLPPKVLLDHREAVYRVSFNESGKILASASSDRTIKLWSLDGVVLQTLQKHNAIVSDISFSPDSKTIASADFDQNLVIWNLNLDDLLKQSCGWLRDYLKSKQNSHESGICQSI